MKNQMLKRVVTFCAIGALALPSVAFAQSDWTDFFDYQGTSFYYSPGSVQHSGDYVSVKWHDTNLPSLVYTAQINCSAQTIQSLAVDRYDPQSGAFIETVDLRNNSTADAIGGSYTMAGHLAQTTC